MRWARDLACVMEVGQCGYMGILLLYIMSMLLKLGLEIICTYILTYICTYSVQSYTKYGFYSYSWFIDVFNLLLHIQLINQLN